MSSLTQDPSPTSITTADESANEVPPRFRLLAHYMDDAFTLPGGKKIGWDGIIGLIPGFGDIAGTLIASYMVFFAARQGVSKLVILRMLYNICIEALVGFIPLIGDLFDFFYKANTRNLHLLERHYRNPSAVKKNTLAWLVFFGVVIVGSWIALIWAFVFLLQLVLAQF